MCRVKYIDRNNIEGYIAVNLTKSIKTLWIHGVIYYKYNTYQKIATEYWDDYCAWKNGQLSFVLDYLKPLIDTYSNLNHSCPFSAGLFFTKFGNISLQKFIIPQIIPAGRYRLEINITEDKSEIPLLGMSVYGSISDHRIEIV